MAEMTPELLDKLEMARALLYVHGYLPDAENAKVKKRIKKACDKAGLKVRTVSLAGGHEL